MAFEPAKLMRRNSKHDTPDTEIGKSMYATVFEILITRFQ